MASIQTKTIAAGGTLQVNVSSKSQVEVSNSSWGSLALTSSTGDVPTRTDTANATFLSEMEDMLFTATGGSTYTISVKPLSGNDEPREFTMT